MRLAANGSRIEREPSISLHRSQMISREMTEIDESGGGEKVSNVCKLLEVES
jgi:hypothetical protein